MAIKSIQILNVMVFQRQQSNNKINCNEDGLRKGNPYLGAFHLGFCDGINVLIGENGVGKTTILKMIYAATQWSFEKTNPGKTKRLLDFFSNNIKNSETLKNVGNKEGYCYYKVSDGTHVFEDSLSHGGIFNFDDWLGLNIPSVFIPTTEMLSHAKGFLAMNQKYSMPFDGTQVDIIVNASLPEAREIPDSCKAILGEISDVIDGTVIQEEDTFYVLKKDGRKIDFSLEAEGLRKLGLLWKLIRNGLLEKGSILLWDEPEANLNPELYPLVANILLELQKNGVQIFVATHSYNFAKYLEIRRTKTEQVMFHNLYMGTARQSEVVPKSLVSIEEDEKKPEVYGDSAYKLEDLKPNHIMLADDKLLDEVYDI
ncbi:MAG: AAA family ATPase [Clostridiales bacterium]|nr:AAA family ATPase [Clostridiales bacterium]